MLVSFQKPAQKAFPHSLNIICMTHSTISYGLAVGCWMVELFHFYFNKKRAASNKNNNQHIFMLFVKWKRKFFYIKQFFCVLVFIHNFPSNLEFFLLLLFIFVLWNSLSDFVFSYTHIFFHIILFSFAAAVFMFQLLLVSLTYFCCYIIFLYL